MKLETARARFNLLNKAGGRARVTPSPSTMHLSTDGVDAVHPVTAVTNTCELASFAVW